MFYVSNAIAKFVSFWIVFVIARIVVVAQSASDISILKGILGESLTVGVVLILAYYMMNHFTKELEEQRKETRIQREYNQKRDERIEMLTERLIKADEINSKALQELITEIKEANQQYREERDHAVDRIINEIKGK